MARCEVYQFTFRPVAKLVKVSETDENLQGSIHQTPDGGLFKTLSVSQLAYLYSDGGLFQTLSVSLLAYLYSLIFVSS